MSYSILYKRLFIRMSDNTVIPLIQSGDNNLYNEGLHSRRQIRVRSWSGCLLCDDKLSYSLQEIKDYLEYKYQHALTYMEPGQTEKDVREHFGWYASLALYGYHTSTTTYSAYKRFFISGYEDAIPFKDFVRVFYGLMLCYWDGEKYVESGLLTDENTLVSEYEAAQNSFGSKVWVKPYHEDEILEAAADLRPYQKGVTLWLDYTSHHDLAINHKRGYLKSLFPFAVTKDTSEAMRVSKSFLQRVNVFRFMDRILEGNCCWLNGVSY